MARPKGWLIPPMLALAIASAFPQASNAASSKWQDLGGGKARLVAIKDPSTDAIKGMVEVVLDEGWKTYWRSPGGSGIPPEFDFSRSQNLSIDTVAFPVPQWIEIPSSSFAGYKDNVRFVFEGKAQSMDSEMHLDVLIGVCEEICIPATAAFTISADELNRSDPKATMELSMAELDLPIATPENSVPVLALAYSANNLKILVQGKEPSNPPVLYLEGPEIWNLAQPKYLSSDATGHTFELDIPESVTSSEIAETRLRYTVVTSGQGRALSGIEGYLSFPE